MPPLKLPVFAGTVHFATRRKINRRDGVVVRASASQSVDLGSLPKSSHTKRLQNMIFTASLLGAQHKKGIVWRTSRQACLLCP